VFQRNEGFDLGELIQKYLGPAVVGFFVFVLPAIRAAQTAKKEREALKRRAEERGPSPPGEAREGRQAWQDLLQGRGSPPSAPPPLPRSTGEEESLEESSPPPLVDLPSSRLPSAAEGEGDEEQSAEELVARREREEASRQVEVAAAEYAAASPYRAEVAPQAASAVPVVTRPRAAPKGAAEVWLFPIEPARDRRAALQRAIVLREVLGPPLGLR
jgi:hypothetical protein